MANDKQKVNIDEESLKSIADLMGKLLDKQTAVLATKEELRLANEELQNELKESEIRLKSYIHEGVETVMGGMEKDVRELKLNSSKI